MLRIPGQKLNTPVTFPAVLSKSRDYNAVEILFVTIFNYFYNLSSESKNIHNPFRCRNKYLPLLAELYRYEYSNVESVQLEREIISSVPNLHHNKGTVIGINNALALSKVDKTNAIQIPWFYNKEKNLISVIVFDNLKTYKLRELLSLVIPLGTKLIFTPGRSINPLEEIELHSWTEIKSGEIREEKAYQVTPNSTWKTVWDPTTESYHTYVDYSRNIGDDGMELATGATSHNTAGTRVGNTEIKTNPEKISKDDNSNVSEE